jgi:hypothetical protein
MQPAPNKIKARIDVMCVNKFFIILVYIYKYEWKNKTTLYSKNTPRVQFN